MKDFLEDFKEEPKLWIVRFLGEIAMLLSLLFEGGKSNDKDEKMHDT